MNIDDNKLELYNYEKKSIINNEIIDNNFLHPVLEKKSNNNHINLINNLTKKINLEPIFAIRYSSSSFEVDSLNTPSS